MLKNGSWQKISVYEKGCEKKDFYKNKQMRGIATSMSKIIQVNGRSVYLVGGSKFFPALLQRDYAVERSCLKIDVSTGQLT